MYDFSMNFAEAFGALFIWMLPVGLLYGKLLRKIGLVHCYIIGLLTACFFEAVTLTIFNFIPDLVFHTISCVIGIEAARFVIRLNDKNDA